MNKENAIYVVIGLLLGFVVTGFVAGQAVNNNYTGMMRMMGMDTSSLRQDATSHSMMSMDDMPRQLEGLKGDDYDKAFIEMMIDHHEGAIAMARHSESRSGHAEVKQLSSEIIVAQEKEITQMKQWQKDWGYSADEMMDMMHGSH